METRVRPTVPADRDDWLSLRSQLWPSQPLDELSREVDSHLAGGDLWQFGAQSILFAVFVAEHPGRGVVGFLEASVRPWVDECQTAPVGYIEGWFVAPAFRRRGIGKDLVRAAEGWAKSKGCKEMASDTGVENRVSERCHIALGYSPVDRLIHFRRELV